MQHQVSPCPASLSAIDAHDTNPSYAGPNHLLCILSPGTAAAVAKVLGSANPEVLAPLVTTRFAGLLSPDKPQPSRCEDDRFDSRAG
jgi:hypothetical protein